MWGYGENDDDEWVCDESPIIIDGYINWGWITLSAIEIRKHGETLSKMWRLKCPEDEFNDSQQSVSLIFSVEYSINFFWFSNFSKPDEVFCLLEREKTNQKKR